MVASSSMHSEVSLLEVARFGEPEVKEALFQLSFDQLERLRKFSGVVLEEKYNRNHSRTPAYGNLPRNFSQRQLKKFFSVIRNHRLKTSFLVMLLFGLRVGELDGLVWLRDQRLLRVRNFKCRRDEYLPVFGAAEAVLTSFFSEPRHSTQKLRYHFRTICAASGDEFTYVYGYSSHKNPRQLYQFTTHTLRHTAATLFFNSTNNPYKVGCFLRHSKGGKFGTTATYMHYSLDDMREDLQATFKDLISNPL